MPLFFKKKPSEDSKKKLEFQLCLSKEAGADDVLDISACELSEVIESICPLFQVLILHNNELRSLVPKGCDIGTLATLKVLDLHENKLTSLPEDIGKLTSLQILNVEKNRLKSLPPSIGDLQLLQTLNVKGNCLCELPFSIGSLSSLRTLNVSDNNIVQLPKQLAYIRTLETFTLDAAMMTYPPSSVCVEGTESIQRFLCSEVVIEYCPPSQYLLPVLEHDCGKQDTNSFDSLEEAWKNKFSNYEKRKEEKQQQKLDFERHLEEKQKEHTQLFLMNIAHKESMLSSVRQEQERLEHGVSQQQKVQDAERMLMLEKVRQAEDDISSRINNMLMDNNSIRMEHLAAITQEEANSLRKKEVAVAMQRMLSDSSTMSLLHEVNDVRRQTLVSETCKSMEYFDRKFDRVMSLQLLDKSKAITQIIQEEEMQKAAFQALQLQKDAVHNYIRDQIKLIEDDLKQLTKLEIKRRNLDTENLQEFLVEQRSALSGMLQQLMKQRDQREQELRQVLVEMQLKSDSNQQNYWMIQYQRLLNTKPLTLRMQEAGVETGLVNMLCKLSAQHYLPILVHHKVTTESLRHMKSSDLKKLGIHEIGVQKALLNWAASVPMASPPLTPSLLPNAIVFHAPSSPVTPGTPVTPSAPSPVEGPGISECVVCMEAAAQIIFLPCGHVCCCQVCSGALQGCPLCRSTILQCVRLYHG
uniref:Leucine rich repeat and sterile alpha motif containing 1 n=1 Tax=Takifugu rubripes TaxID=31033 RepID=A0A674PJT8_TAKRU